jgi:hypothetical protein
LVCAAGDRNDKINCNTGSRDDSGLCADMGCGDGHPRPVKKPGALPPLGTTSNVVENYRFDIGVWQHEIG